MLACGIGLLQGCGCFVELAEAKLDQSDRMLRGGNMGTALWAIRRLVRQALPNRQQCLSGLQVFFGRAFSSLDQRVDAGRLLLFGIGELLGFELLFELCQQFLKVRSVSERVEIFVALEQSQVADAGGNRFLQRFDGQVGLVPRIGQLLCAGGARVFDQRR